MKKLSVALLAISLLLPAGSASAYAIYNHVDHKVCVGTFWSFFIEDCKFTIPAGGTHNGGPGDSLSHVTVAWREDHRTKCFFNPDTFNIPKGGYARIYPDEVKVYKHDGTHVESRPVTKGKCVEGKKKP